MKSHFQFSRKQRSGIFLLVLIIVAVQLILFFFTDFISKDENNIIDISQFETELDSLRANHSEKDEYQIFPFNPNFITDYKGYALGMSTKEVDRLLEFRKQGKWINSTTQFKEITQVSDSLLLTISPFFKFPDWVTNTNNQNSFSQKSSNFGFTAKSYKNKVDLNVATLSQLKRISGIGDKLADRIIRYREKHKGGFISDVELSEVYGLQPEVIDRILNEFTVKTPRRITILNINTASRDELVTIPYIDYEIAYSIIEQRTLREGYNSLEELTKVKDFPVNKLDIIKLYLSFE